MTIKIILLLAGLFLVIKGADWLIKGGGALARRYHIPELVIGITVVAFGTSLPELVVNVFASVQGQQELILGNVIGSNNFNLFVILGISGLIAPLVVQSGTVWREIPVSLLAAVLLLFLANGFVVGGGQQISRIDGLVLLLFFVAFLYYIFRQIKSDPIADGSDAPALKNYKIWLFIGLGLAGLLIGGRLAVDNAVIIATRMGVSQKIIGLTIIAMGTSLPELVTSVVAVLKKSNDIAVGNIIGSNIFNILLITGISTLIRPIPYETGFNFDQYFLIGGTLFLFIAMFTGQRKKLDRWEAGVLVAAYLVYLAVLIQQAV